MLLLLKKEQNMKKLFTGMMIFLISLSSSAVTFTEDQTTRPIVLKFGTEDVLKSMYPTVTYEFMDKVGTTRVELRFSAGLALMTYFNTDGYKIFDEVVDSAQVARMIRSVLSKRACPITFTVLPEEKKFENIHLGCPQLFNLS